MIVFFFGLKHISYFKIILPDKSIPVARRLRHGSAADRLPGMRVRIAPGRRMSIVRVVCCQVEVSSD